MTPTIHRELKCDECGAVTRFPQDVIDAVFSDPDALPNDLHAIGFPCRNCANVKVHFLKGKMVALQELDESIVSSYEKPLLRCNDPSCQFRLPIMSQRPRGITDEDHNKSRYTWDFTQLACPYGHPILKPPEWQPPSSARSRTFQA